MTAERIQSRNNGRRGFLDAAALRSGIREQWATMRGSDRVAVELAHEGTWVVYERIAYVETSESRSTATTFTTLDEARREFRRLVRKHQ